MPTAASLRWKPVEDEVASIWYEDAKGNAVQIARNIPRDGIRAAIMACAAHIGKQLAAALKHNVECRRGDCHALFVARGRPIGMIWWEPSAAHLSTINVLAECPRRR